MSKHFLLWSPKGWSDQNGEEAFNAPERRIYGGSNYGAIDSTWHEMRKKCKPLQEINRKGLQAKTKYGRQRLQPAMHELIRTFRGDDGGASLGRVRGT